ncbi:D-alanine-D-alanine ligase [Conyzicola lurida]|uniref:D-alanine-D-alanine ligase n=1 Tax=Conyzicola lurida TaxID=1172621 RepID=A0A841AR72_9MICO|nr:D-alanine-D-alanine ligase [Conyzicola lurida]
MSSPWAVLFGGPSPEHEISILTGLQSERVLTASGEAVLPIYWAPNGEWWLVPAGTEAKDYLTGVPKGSKAVDVRVSGDTGLYVKKRALDISAVLLTLHGGLGEGGGAAALFTLLGIPATGSTLFAGAVGMDKLAFGGLMEVAGIPTLRRELLSATHAPSFPGPYIVKPRFGGSSIGIEIVEDVDAARAVASASAHLRAGAVVEPYRPELVDLNIGFRTFPQLAVTALEKPIRVNAENGLYSYADKYLSGGAGSEVGLTSAPREFPANVPDAVATLAAELATRVAEVTGLTGVVRVDLLLDESNGELFVNEVNSIPGAMSLYLWAPQAPAATVLKDALVEARDRRVVTPASGFGSGAALRAAGGIAGKLVGLDGPRG